jgi:3-hydroxyacyl-CoA dehydrogenase
MMDLGPALAVDDLTGPVVGHPRALFQNSRPRRPDTIIHVANNVYEGALNDEKREVFKIPDFIRQMLEKKLLGEKTKQGFYKAVKEKDGKKSILSLNYKTMEYVPQQKVKMASLEAAKNIPGTAGKVKSLFYADDLAGKFIFRTMAETLLYAANRIPEIADDIVNVDNAMKWGFARKMGPFEGWDVLGLKPSTERMKKAGYKIPGWVQEMLDTGKESFYKRELGVQYYYDPALKDFKQVPAKPGIILLPSLKDRQKKWPVTKAHHS